jgi:hypothetical protein
MLNILDTEKIDTNIYPLEMELEVIRTTFDVFWDDLWSIFEGKQKNFFF